MPSLSSGRSSKKSLRRRFECFHGSFVLLWLTAPVLPISCAWDNHDRGSIDYVRVSLRKATLEHKFMPEGENALNIITFAW